ncbi:MAG TPA: alpha/beta hydrolase [Solirubrobacteraceae bacterium]|nr:alpha/beta hydrolase [Solirubrobacteraceae bacterium]
MEVGFEEIAGRRVQVAEGGSGPPLLYLHSAAGEALVWLDVLSGLAEDRTVVAPAHPGFWQSEGLETIHDIEDLANHYLALMDARGWEQVDVMGSSLGGWIAMELAARWPERVGRMVLAASVGIRVPDVPMADVFAMTLGKEEDARALSFHDPHHPLAKIAIPDLMSLNDEDLANFLRAMAATAKVAWNPYMHDPRLEGMLPRVSADTLLIWGRSDKVVPVPYGERLAELIPQARLVVVEECGHSIMLEQPQAVLEAARGHLRAGAAAAA